MGWGNRVWLEGGGTERDGVGEQGLVGRGRYRKGWGGGTGFGWKGEVQKGMGWGNRVWLEGGGTERDGVGEQEVGGRGRYRKGWGGGTGGGGKEEVQKRMGGVVRIAMKRDKKGR